MDINKRFDQLESLLVDLARKQDQQAEQIARILQILGNHGESINSLGELLNGQTEVIHSNTEVLNSHTEVLHSLAEIATRHTASLERQEIRLDAVGDQIGDIINILKISEARHTETEQRQDVLLAEIKTQGQRQDVAVEALRVLLKRQESTDSRLDGVVQTQLQMLQLMRADADKVDGLAQRLPGVEGQEPRIKRLEDKVFRAAS
ncbi:hypothetical protein [Hymenobacter cheonanensis]|uniref:hypothetical protein n=1 Tax=Hymenobacter sp. CA2-7 TaxID=3063993 RepID=UPI0027138D4B|nr:hypothetical protein [Hymenobacter sp. CA2-7]MDO7886068.1 hypothetical protein [Hymenobacter sp. CA2-7]